MSAAEAVAAEAERLVFHDSPAAALAALAPLDLLALASADPVAVARATWVRGVALGASGQYGSALAELLPPAAELPERTSGVAAGASTSASGAADPALRWRAAAAVAAASLYRQIGLFADALAWDSRAAAATAGRPQCVGVRFEAVLGTAADAVGAGSLEVARDRLAAAGELLDALPTTAWREQVRYGWVACEVALLGGDAVDAVAAAEAAATTAAKHGARRHLAKSTLFLAVARQTAAEAAAAPSEEPAPGADGSTGDAFTSPRELLVSAAALAEEVGAHPLVWVAGRLAAQWLADADADAARYWHRAAGSAVRSIVADLPPDLRAVLSKREDAAEFLTRPRG